MSTPRHTAPKSPAPVIPLRPASPAGLLYTILRHGRGRSHEEACRHQRESLERGFTPAA